MLKKAEVVRLQQIEHMISERAILAALDHPFTIQPVSHHHYVIINYQSSVSHQCGSSIIIIRVIIRHYSASEQ